MDEAGIDLQVIAHAPPGPPHRAMIDAYFKDCPTMDGAGLGFTFETAARLRGGDDGRECEGYVDRC